MKNLSSFGLIVGWALLGAFSGYMVLSMYSLGVAMMLFGISPAMIDMLFYFVGGGTMAGAFIGLMKALGYVTTK